MEEVRERTKQRTLLCGIIDAPRYLSCCVTVEGPPYMTPSLLVLERSYIRSEFAATLPTLERLSPDHPSLVLSDRHAPKTECVMVTGTRRNQGLVIVLQKQDPPTIVPGLIFAFSNDR